MKKKIVIWEDAVELEKERLYSEEENKSINKVYGLSKDNVLWGNEIEAIELDDHGLFVVNGKDNFGEDAHFILPDWLFEQ